jgi:hypothetical protein
LHVDPTRLPPPPHGAYAETYSLHRLYLKKRDRRCVSHRTPPRTQLAPRSKRCPRKDPAVHVSLPSDAIVKQQAPQGRNSSESERHCRFALVRAPISRFPVLTETKTGEKADPLLPFPFQGRAGSGLSSLRSRPSSPPRSPAPRPAVQSPLSRRTPPTCQTLSARKTSQWLPRGSDLGKARPAHCTVSRNKALVFRQNRHCASDRSKGKEIAEPWPMRSVIEPP